ncbi:transketolase [Nitrosomonas sp. Is37]|uniref:transketolase n=1 Tax=Nitrosomonas sp. Is37 TaxID=3080535 RepID=UPI00294B26B9|nr:transketolase [Nitrosomonas sp. Is37]MDV6345083.1 transketolase [Nitrosomonas sp. Is37]
MNSLDKLCINTLRFLAVDAVERAHSGHPGLPLGAAPMAYVLWTRFLRHNPRNPSWLNRDRFLLSAGHGSALLYALLHTTGYDLSLDDLKHFRQWGSKTPGHPEYGKTPGVEATTGPLGQGFAMGIGMALAERHLSSCFNRPGFPLIDHYTYAIVSDGDLMEGISSEAASLAGTLGLGKLIYLYDNNHISLEGDTDLVFTESVQHRFEAYGWHVLSVANGNDIDAIEQAINAARSELSRPSLLLIRTHVGYGSPKQDTASAHGEPLGEEALKATKKNFGWPLEPEFYIPKEAQAHFQTAITKGANWEKEWNEMLDAYQKEHSALAVTFRRLLQRELPNGWNENLPSFSTKEGQIATRDASGKILNVLAEKLPVLIGGSADLNPSTKTTLMGYGDFGFDQFCGRNIHFGVREHAMGAIVNGMALHGAVLPYGATFLIFSDYMRPPIRLAALMQTHSIFIFTHDSIGLGEDGPTHQPVEQLASLRAIPGFIVMRPADANETRACWQVAVSHRGPVALVLSRQKLPVLDPSCYPIVSGVQRGAYILAEAQAARPDLILIGTGSEVSLILQAREMLIEKNVQSRVVSMPSWELFDAQPREYRESVLTPGIPKLAVEAAAPFGWCKYVGDSGDIISVNRFGASAPGETVMHELGFSVENVVARAMALLS